MNYDIFTDKLTEANKAYAALFIQELERQGFTDVAISSAYAWGVYIAAKYNNYEVNGRLHPYKSRLMHLKAGIHGQDATVYGSVRSSSGLTKFKHKLT